VLPRPCWCMVPIPQKQKGLNPKSPPPDPSSSLVHGLLARRLGAGTLRCRVVPNLFRLQGLRSRVRERVEVEGFGFSV
jgi:hypothetical protein